MGRSELFALEQAATQSRDNVAEICFKLGMFYSIGGSVPADKVAAHKWFKLANEMSEYEIAAAQRAAREWIVAVAH